MGEVIAFEIAKQLHAKSQEVAVLALFDTFPPNYRAQQSALRKFFSLPTHLRLIYLAHKLGYRKRQLARDISNYFLPKALKEVRKACEQASKHYVPTPYSGRIILFRAFDRFLGNSDDELLGWDQFALEGIEIHRVTGHHLNIPIRAANY